MSTTRENEGLQVLGKKVHIPLSDHGSARLRGNKNSLYPR